MPQRKANGFLPQMVPRTLKRHIQDKAGLPRVFGHWGGKVVILAGHPVGFIVLVVALYPAIISTEV